MPVMLRNLAAQLAFESSDLVVVYILPSLQKVWGALQILPKFPILTRKEAVTNVHSVLHKVHNCSRSAVLSLSW